METPAPGELCDVYLAGAADVRALEIDRPAATADLTEVEHRRYDRLRVPNARRDFLAVRLIARSVIAQELGLLPRDVVLAQRCPTCSSDEHGRPLPVDGVRVSWSHTSAAVAVAVSRAEIGVDVETMRSLSAAPAEIEAMICTRAEAASLPREPAARQLALARLWTVKEALIKVGESTLADLRHTQVGISAAGRTWRGQQRSWYLTPLVLDGAVGTVAAAGPARVHQFELAQLAV